MKHRYPEHAPQDGPGLLYPQPSGLRTTPAYTMRTLPHRHGIDVTPGPGQVCPSAVHKRLQFQVVLLCALACLTTCNLASTVSTLQASLSNCAWPAALRRAGQLTPAVPVQYDHE